MALNDSFVDRYTTQSLAAHDALSIPAASVAAVAATITDVGTSLFNSAVVGIPKLLGVDTSEYSASTFDLLSSVNSDWANFYRNNEDAISTASFIAGSLLPTGLALKGMKMLQAGKLGLYPTILTDAAQTGRIAKLTAQLSEGAGATSEFAALRWKILGIDATQQIAQAAGMEVALLATFNEHPFLEDYFKDPIKNFGISMLIGGVIGGGIGQIILRKDLALELGAVESGALKQTTDKLIVVPHGLADNDLFQRLLSNAEIADGVAADETLNPLAQQIATKFASVFRGAAANAYERVEGTLLTNLKSLDGKSDTITRMAIKNFMGRESNFGAQGVELAGFAEDTLGKVSTKFVFRGTQTARAIAEAISPEEKRQLFYHGTGAEPFTQFDSSFIGTGEGAQSFGHGLYLAEDARVAGGHDGTGGYALSTSKRTVGGQTFNRDSTFHQASDIADSTGSRENAIKYINTMPEAERIKFDDVMKILKSNQPLGELGRRSDLYTAEVKQSTLNKMIDIDKSIAEQTPEVRMLIRKNMSDEEFKQLIIKSQGDMGGAEASNTLKKYGITGFKYFDRSSRSAGKGTRNIVIFNEADARILKRGETQINKASHEVAGFSQEDLLKMGELQRQGLISSVELNKTLPNWKQLMEHEFAVYHSPHFDAYIPFDKVQQYIRAVDTGQKDFRTSSIFKLNGDASAELVTREVSTALADRPWIDALGTAASVNTPKQVFVHSNDLPVINAWVSKAAAQEELGVAQETKYFMTNSISDVQSVMKQEAREVTLEDLTNHLAARKEQIARDLFAEGAHFQEISLRINTNVDTVERMFMERAPLSSYAGWRSYTNAADITTEYLHPKGQMLKLTTNGSRAASLRYRNADMSANLDQKFLKNADREISSNVIRAIGSPIAQDLFLSFKANDAIFDTIDASLSNIVNTKLGSIALSSADFSTRHMGEVSQAASYIGQRNVGIMNTHAKALLTDLSAAIHSHTTSQAGLNEVNAIFTHLNGLSGYRNWDEVNGVLYKMVPGLDGVMYKQTIKPSAIADLLPRDEFRDTFSPGAQAILTQLKTVSEQMYKLKNTINRIQGFKELDNIGLHIPTFNPNNKYMSYIIDTTTQNKDQKVRMLIGKSPEELASLERRWLSENPESLRPGIDLVRMSDKEAYNAVKMRLDPMDMDFADVNKFHSGASASAVRVVDDSLTGTLIENLHGRVLYYSRQLQEMYLHETMSTLDMMSKLNRGLTDAQPIAAKSLGTYQGDDAALVIKNMILGNNQLSNMTTWKNLNNGVSAGVNYVSNKVYKIWQAFGSEYTKESGPLGLKDWVKHTKELEGVGVSNPFTKYEEYVAMSQPGAKTIDASFTTYKQQVEQLKIDSVARLHNISPASAEQIVAAGNGIIATAALRVMEMGQPFVNAISVPILMLPELMRNLPKTFLGHEITSEGVGVTFPFRIMADGVRARFSDAFKPWIDRWTKEGIGTSIVSEASQLHALTYSEGGGNVAKIQRMLSDPKGIISKLSIPADRMEIETRLVTLSTAVQMARWAYPTITDEAANVFAYNFLNRVIGNYSAAQRPALFQGTVGVALGLFQTYMLSWGQSMFRSIEEGAGKALAAQMLTQAGLFGISSLPGYDLMSKTIASHFSDKHYDLTTGTYRALPNSLAEFITYGLPASIGVGLYTRGDLQPRIPIVSQASPEDQIAAVNVAKQFYGVTAHSMTKVMESQGAGAKVRGLLEGLSMQSLSRPLARIAEIIPLPDGEGGVSAVGSVSREGSTIATSSEVWSTPGIMSRLLSSRSTEEAVKREMDYMASFHATLDSQNKKKATETLKTAIRAGTLSEPGVMEKISGEYLRTGTATGWQAAVNEAVATSVGGIDHKLEKRLQPQDPLQQMISTNF